MSRSMVGLLAAVASTMSALVGLAHGDPVPFLIAGAGTASGLAAYLAMPSSKKISELEQICYRADLI